MADPVAGHFLAALAAAELEPQPFAHWTLRDVLPGVLLDGMMRLPIAPAGSGDTQGRRETRNSTRRFFSGPEQARYPVCRDLAQALQSHEVVAGLEQSCGAKLQGASLRIEYCQDTDGFWLEPHTDIGAKLFTMLVYLNASPAGEQWGTDIYAGPEMHVATAGFAPNLGLIFIPSRDSWHGFARRKITGVRRSLIVNYVSPDWRARHELAFPDRPVF